MNVVFTRYLIRFERKIEKPTPQFISIGPIHKGNKDLEPMEYHKGRYFKSLLCQAQMSAEEFVDAVKKLEPKVRRSYSEEIKLSADEFAQVILLDASFIILLFIKCILGGGEGEDEIIMNPTWSTTIFSDLMLLENQLPFFVLSELFDLLYPTLRQKEREKLPNSFLQLTFWYFDYYNKQKISTDRIINVRHFTDLIRTFYLPPVERLPPRGKHTMRHVPSVIELKEAGLKFKKICSSDQFHCFQSDLSFRGKVLHIPELIVDDYTETLFRNLMALELCHYPFCTYFTEYVSLMDYLINTTKDVDILVNKGIIRNYLGDRERVAKLFNSICNNVVESNNNTCYIGLCENLNDFYNNPYNNCIATLRRDHCRTRWKTVVSIGGIFLLILTTIQAVCSIISVA